MRAEYVNCQLACRSLFKLNISSSPIQHGAVAEVYLVEAAVAIILLGAENIYTALFVFMGG